MYQLALTLELQGVYVVGHDIAGMVAYAFVRWYPHITRGAMILDVAIPGIDGWDEIKGDAVLWHIPFMQGSGNTRKTINNSSRLQRPPGLVLLRNVPKLGGAVKPRTDTVGFLMLGILPGNKKSRNPASEVMEPRTVREVPCKEGFTFRGARRAHRLTAGAA